MAELKLDVTLNIAGFRSQLGKLAQTAGAYYYPVNVLINKKNLTTQLEAIGRTLGKKKYRIDLNDTSVGLAAEKIEKLAASLKNLSGSIKIDFNAGGGTKTIGTAMKEMATKMAKESKGDINKAVAKMVEMRGEAPFGSGTRSIPGFKSAAKGMGVESAFKLFFQELNQIDPQKLRKALDDGSVMMMGENRELKQKFDKIQSSAESLAQDLRAMGETARTTGRASLSTGGKTLYPQNYGLKIASLLSQIDKLGKDLRKVSAQSGTELLNNLTELTSVLRTTSNSFVGISGFSDSLDQTLRRFDTATKAATAATNAYADRINRRAGGVAGGAAAATAGPGLLPGRAPGGALAISSREGASKVIEVQIRSAFNIIEDYHKTQLDNFTRNYKQNIDAYHKAILTQQLINTANAARRRIVPAIVSEGGQPRLPPAAERKMLPAESGLSEFRRIVDGAVSEYFKSVGHGPLNQGPLPPLPRTPLMLPAAGETTAGLNRPRITTGSFGEGFASPFDRNRGYVPPGGFPSDGKMPIGKQGPANFIGAGSQAEKFKTALDVATASSQNFRASQLPLIGGLKGIAGELGQATKQVLLYGAAYKGLGFVMSLPGQLLNAAKSQQQFTNALKVSTQETGTFAKEMLFVDNVQRAFGLNLETTRTGFVRLYASMAPTGFDSGSIEKLFTGISAATAALQLTPDKAERVIYAFGQMASKGQIMAEELKGQLGDVLPGALAIFSKAAGMSVKDFSKAMEDGAFVGGRFREVFAKVSDELINRFGTGAQVAGRSLQGLINTVGGDFQRVLESFSPLANSAAQAILGPLGGSLKQLSLSAQIATGEIERVFMQLKQSQQDLMDLRTSAGTDGIITAEETSQIKAAEQNVAALTARYKSLQQAASDPAIAKQAADITKFTEELAKAGTFVMNVARTIGGILAPALNFLGTNLTTVIGLITSFYIGFQTARLAAMALMGVLLLFRTLSAILGLGPASLSANALATAFNGLGVAATGAQVKVIGLRVALTALVAATVIGAVVAGIVAIAGAFATMRDRAKEASESSRDAAKSAIEAAQTGNTAQAAMAVQTVLGESRKAAAARKALEGIMARSTKEQRAGVAPMSLTMEESVALKGSALTEGMVKPAIRGKPQIQVPSKEDAAALLRQFGSVAGQQDLSLRETKSALKTAQEVNKKIGLDKPTPGTPAAESGDDKKKTNLESYASLEDQLAKDFTQAQIDRLEAEHQHKVDLINAEYDLKEAKANSFQKEALKFERRMVQIDMERQGALLKASSSVLAAQGSVAGGAGGGGGIAMGGVVATTGGARNQDPVTRGSSTGAHLHAQAANMTEDTLRYLVDKYLEIGGKAATSFGQSRGSAGHGYNAIDFLTPQDTPIKLKAGASMSQYGPAGGRGGLMGQVSTPEGNFELGHLTSLTSAQGVDPGPKRKVLSSEKRDLVAQQKVQIELSRQSDTVRQQETKSLKDAEIALANFVAAATPVNEQKLQNSLLERRTDLMTKGYSDEVIDRTLKFYEAEYNVSEGIAVNKRLLDAKIISQAQADKNTKTMTEGLQDYSVALNENTTQLNKNKFAQAMGSLKDRMKVAQAFTSDQELKTQISLDYRDSSPEKQQEIYNLTKVAKNLEDTKALIGNFVSSTSNDYKGFLKAVISGEDAVDALQKFQEGLTDKVLTIFLDFAMAPVEEVMKKSLGGLFAPKANTTEVPVVANTTELTKNTAATIANTNAITGKIQVQPYDPTKSLPSIPDFSKNAFNISSESAFAGFNTEDMFGGLNEQIRAGLAEIPSSFAEATANLQISSEPFKQALIAELPNTITAAGEGVKTQGATFGEGLTSFVGGIGAAAAGIAGIAAGISQIGKGGTSNVLGGIGSVLMGAGGAIGGFGKIFGFADGGMVSGPTLGMVGEGKYNEAIVPLPNGRSIPVQFNQESSLRSAMGSDNSNNSVSPVLSMSFETTRFGNTDYVSRDQLEAAMMQTRAEATKAGARRGMTMTLDKLQQSPSTRSRVGLG